MREDKDLEKNTENSEEENQGAVKKVSSAILVVLAIFIFALMFFADFIEHKFGKIAGTIALCVVAAVMAALLYKDKIKRIFRRK